MIREIEKEEKIMGRNERQRLRREARQQEQKEREEEEAANGNAADVSEARSQARPLFT